MKKYDLVTLGEIIVDFTPDGHTPDGFPRYIQNPGGAVVNVAAAFAKYGARAGFIGRVGDDLFGRALRGFLTELGVDCGGLSADPDYNTTLAFVSLAPTGERDFAFYRRHEADLRLSPEDLPRDMLADAKLFHFGSLSLCAEPAREATLTAVRLAKEAGALVSFDPNYRESLRAGGDFVSHSKNALRQADLVKVSEEEGEMLTGLSDPAAIARALLDEGPKFAAVTMGAKGSCYAAGDFCGYAEPYSVRAVDTTGAGDVFFATFLHEYVTKEISLTDEASVRRAVLLANKAAALCTTKKGGAPSVPDYADL